MKQTKVVLFSIDVEPDSHGDTWTYRDPLSFRGVTHGICEDLHPLFQRYRARPTYLLNNVVIQHGPVSELSKLDNAELGSHLHPDFVEPEVVHENPAGKRGVGNQCFLQPEIEAGKMSRLTAMFQEAFGRSPTSFRAGRYGIGNNTIRILEELGYQVDTSVTPGLIWGGDARLRRLNFRRAPQTPYHPDRRDFLRAGNGEASSILEVPVSIWTAPFRRPRWLRPGFSDNLVDVAKRMIAQLSGERTIVLNVMFHNVDIVAELSPHAANPSIVDRSMKSLEALLEFLVEEQFGFMTLSDFAAAYDNGD